MSGFIQQISTPGKYNLEVSKNSLNTIINLNIFIIRDTASFVSLYTHGLLLVLMTLYILVYSQSSAGIEDSVYNIPVFHLLITISTHKYNCNNTAVLLRLGSFYRVEVLRYTCVYLAHTYLVTQMKLRCNINPITLGGCLNKYKDSPIQN